MPKFTIISVRPHLNSFSSAPLMLGKSTGKFINKLSTGKCENLRDTRKKRKTDEKIHHEWHLALWNFHQVARKRGRDDEPFMLSSSSFPFSSHCKCGHIVGVLGNLFSKAVGEIESFQSQL